MTADDLRKLQLRILLMDVVSNLQHSLEQDDIFEQLDREINRRSLTWEQVGAKAGVNRVTVWRWRSNRAQPFGKTLTRILAAISELSKEGTMAKTGSKQEALDLFEENYADYLKRARMTAIRLSKQRGPITIEAVRANCPPPPKMPPNVMGAVFRGKEWQCVGFEPAQRKAARTRIIRLWKWEG